MLRVFRLVPAVVAVAVLAGFALAGVGAAGGVPLPAEAGTEWRIVAGYNTGTHSEADGHDPHAIDLVREDAATGGSAVLAPTSGAVSFISLDCLSIRDGAGMEHLLCHIQPTEGLRRGAQVVIGEQVGIVWEDGQGKNGGLAHIHYAVHQSRGGGRLGETVPFTGAYAIEGVELLAGSGFNLHGDERFVSTNRRDWQAPAETRVVAAADSEADDASAEDAATSGGVDDGADDADDASSGEGAAAGDDETSAVAGQEHGRDHDHGAQAATAPRAATETVIGGWRTIAIERPTTVGAVWSRRGSTLESLFYWDRVGQRWQAYQPELPGGAAAAWISLSPGDAVLGNVQDEAAWLPRIARAQTPPTLELRAGWNFVSWHGADMPAAEAFGGLESLVSALLWDNAGQRYLNWGAEGANTLETVPGGGSLWIELGAAEVWAQGG